MEKLIVKAFMSLKTRLSVQAWVLESAFVLAVLLATAALSGKGWVEYLAVLAVYFTFKHASVSERLREANEANTKMGTAETTSCAHKLEHFFYLKELLWVAFFTLSGAWSALAGCGIFFLYGWWRKVYRKHHPRKTTVAKAGGKYYRHFKYEDNQGIGGCYEMVHVGEFTETGDRTVIYRPLYKLPNMWDEGVTVLVRTETNFNEPVDRGGTIYLHRFLEVTDPETIEACRIASENLYK